jgi:uncharacterized protein YfbU (UPF0304 family)
MQFYQRTVLENQYDLMYVLSENVAEDGKTFPKIFLLMYRDIL